MKQKVKERNEKREKEENLSENSCQHFWDIEAANGPSSQGICKFCGKTKEFLNSFPDFNPMKRKNNPLDLPKMPDVEIDEDSKS